MGLQSGEITDLRHLHKVRRNKVFEGGDGRVEEERETRSRDQASPESRRNARREARR